MARGDRSTATRETLIKSAARVFTRRGQYGATVREIAEDAGLTVPALYYHFEGTDELYTTVVREGRARFRAMLSAAVEEPGDAEARLRSAARVFGRFGREDPSRLRLLAAHLFGPHDPDHPDRDAEELQAWIERVLSPLVAEVAGTDEVQRASMVRLFVAIMNGLLVEQARAPESPLLDDDIADRAVAVFLRGARA
jgi:AcrR family transcriptional regulator